MVTILTHIQILDTDTNYVIQGNFDTKQAFRIVNKHNYEPIKEPINEYFSNYAKKNNTQLIVNTIQCKTV